MVVQMVGETDRDSFIAQPGLYYLLVRAQQLANYGPGYALVNPSYFPPFLFKMISLMG